MKTINKVFTVALTFLLVLNIYMAGMNSNEINLRLKDLQLQVAIAAEIPEITITCNTAGNGYCSYLLCADCSIGIIYKEECYCHWTGYQDDFCDGTMECDCGDC